MKLAIISHTPHYIRDNQIVGWGSTVREINHLTDIFDEIFHIAPLHKGKPPGSSSSYTSKRIKFVPIKPYGGKGLIDKISVISTSFHNLKKMQSVMPKVDWVQFRAPTAMGLYVLPYLSLKRNLRKWVKYAGNWKMEDPPLSYRFQKWWLQNNFQNSKVTINGQWENQEKHILNFQNPCLDEKELTEAKEIALNKNFDDKLTFCFAGMLTKNKGVDLILEALRRVSGKEMIREVIFAGDGIDRDRYERIASDIKISIVFKGFLDRTCLEAVYKESNIILLPSESEGFPKVIAEAAAFGCVPIVSDVSSIGQYFNETNGFLLKEITAEELAGKIDFALADRTRLKKMSLNCLNVAELFTFEKYIKDLKEKILD